MSKNGVISTAIGPPTEICTEQSEMPIELRSAIDLDNRRLVVQVDPLHPTLLRKYLAKAISKNPKTPKKRGRPRKAVPNSAAKQEVDDNSDHQIKEPDLLTENRYEGKKRKALPEADVKCTARKIPKANNSEVAGNSETEYKSGKKNISKPKNRSESEQQIGPCSLCQLKFRSEEELSTHICRKCYRLPNKRWQCALCTSNYGPRGHTLIKDHMKVHTGERPFACKYGCGARFRVKGTCRIHERSGIHENARDYKCDICNKTFTANSSLFQHRAIHAEFQFRCNICPNPKAFAKKEQLIAHEKRHRGETVPCKICGKGVAEVRLRRHERRCTDALNKLKKDPRLQQLVDASRRMPDFEEEERQGIFTCRECRLQFKSEVERSEHTCYRFSKLGENVWLCGVCGKVKQLSIALFKAHMKYHLQPPRFDCPRENCNRSFRYESDLKRHAASHEGTKRFVCDTCGAGYIHSYNFLCHLNSKHPEIPVKIKRRPGEGRLRDRLRRERLRKECKPRKHSTRKHASLESIYSIILSSKPTGTAHQEQPQSSVLETAIALQPDVAAIQTYVIPPGDGDLPHSRRAVETYSSKTDLAIPQLAQPQPQSVHNYSAALPDEQSDLNTMDLGSDWQTVNQGERIMESQSVQSFQQNEYFPEPSDSQIRTEFGPEAKSSDYDTGHNSPEPQQSEVELDLDADDGDSVPGAYWEDNSEDPWDAIFQEKKTQNNSRAHKSEAAKDMEVYPVTDETGLFTKLGKDTFRCVYCAKLSKERRLALSHSVVHTDDGSIGCPDCPVRFKSKKAYLAHARIHTKEMSYTCPVCFKPFRQLTSFNNHRKTHGDLVESEPLIPGVPSQPPEKSMKPRSWSERQLADIKRALARIDNGLPFRCGVCLQTYPTGSELNDHMCPLYRPLISGFWQCGICPQQIKHKQFIIKHVARHKQNPGFSIGEFMVDLDSTIQEELVLTAVIDGSEPASDATLKVDTAPPKPSILASDFSSEETRVEPKTHLKTRTRCLRYLCDYDSCGQAFSAKIKLIRHKKQLHPGSVKFNCNFCPRVFKDLMVKNAHEREHKKQAWRVCEYCGFEFYKTSDYNKHIQRHKDGTPTWNCTLCSMKVTSKTELVVHCRNAHNIVLSRPRSIKPVPEDLPKLVFGKPKVESKADEPKSGKPYRHECKQCGRFFRDPCMRDRHIENVHQGKRFNCQYCQKEFTTLLSKQAHERQHRDEVWKYCTECGFGLYNNRSYERHAARHANPSLPKWKCDQCSTELTTSKELDVHRKSHENGTGTPRKESIMEARARVRQEKKQQRQASVTAATNAEPIKNKSGFGKKSRKDDSTSEESELDEDALDEGIPAILVKPEYERLTRRLARRSLME